MNTHTRSQCLASQGALGWLPDASVNIRCSCRLSHPGSDAISLTRRSLQPLAALHPYCAIHCHTVCLCKKREKTFAGKEEWKRCFCVGGFAGRHPRMTVKTEPIKSSDESSRQIREIARDKDTLLLVLTIRKKKIWLCDQSCVFTNLQRIYCKLPFCQFSVPFMFFAAIYLLSSLIVYQAIAKQAQQQQLFMLTMTQVKPFQRETSPEHFFPPCKRSLFFIPLLMTYKNYCWTTQYAQIILLDKI